MRSSKPYHLRPMATSEPAGAATEATPRNKTKFTSEQNYANLCSNMGSIAERPISGYVGRWQKFQGSESKLLAEGDIIYGFRRKDGQPEVCQVWKAEEGDLSSPKLQKQRQQLPQLQKDPLQLQLDMDTLIVEIAAGTPLMEPSLAAAAAQLSGPAPPAAGLAAAMRVLAVPGHGNLVVTGGLPLVGPTEQLGEAHKTWFNRMYMRMPGPDGGLRWSVMLHYDTASGGFLTHYTTWEAAISPGPGSLQQVFTPGAHSATLQQAGLTDRAHGSIENYYALQAGKLSGSFTQLTYDDSMECRFSSGSIDAGDAGSSNPFQQLHGGPEAMEVWYTSGCYFRAPQNVSPECLGGAADVVLEAGAVVGQAGSSGGGGSSSASAGDAIVRWLLCYENEGDRRLKWARNEVYRAA